MSRNFRNSESIEVEQVTRGMVREFLLQRGFTKLNEERPAKGQTIVATEPDGHRLTMRVKLCWRRGQSGGRNAPRVRTYAAAQLIARVKEGDAEDKVRAMVERRKAQGVTHFLIIQRDEDNIVFAALVPISEIVQIWCAQRDISRRLLKQQKLGRRKKNHAENGSSPTLWLQDDRGGEAVANALWQHRGVRDLAKLQATMWRNLPDTKADEPESQEDGNYFPQDEDLREIVERQIKKRRGREKFRNALRERYGDRCMITGCEVLAVLEAAHISPYRGDHDNDRENGLLLRADIHTLFDLNLLGIEPEELRIALHPKIDSAKEYRAIRGKTLRCSKDCMPSLHALRPRYEQFQRRLSEEK